MKVFLPVLLILSTALGFAAIGLREPRIPERQVTNRPIQVIDAGYSSSNTCRSCHPSQYATWHASYHRTMTQVATPETVVADFDGITVTDVHGRPMRLERRGEYFWAEFDDPDGEPETRGATLPPSQASADRRSLGGGGSESQRDAGAARPRITREIVMITGSHHQQVYWYATGQNRLLGQLPAIYLIAERRWIPRRSAVMHPPDEPVFSETGHWNGICIACHATNGKPELDTPFGSQPVDTQVVETTATQFGIACEACHGPSGGHARSNRNPLRRYALHITPRADPTTVLPTRLDARVSSQVCGQCHGVWEFYDAAGERHANSAGLPYRPGDELTKSRFLAQPTRNLDSPTMQALLAEDAGFVVDSFWPDGMVRVSGREYNGLIDSPCFKDATEAGRTLSCSSCHSMHTTATDPRSIREWADDQVTPGMSGNKACLQCHQSIDANLTAHTKHQASSEGSSCYNCHMPYTTYGLLKTIRSHQISSPSVASTVETGRPNACNLCHLDKTLAWTDTYLAKWYGAVAAVGPSFSSGGRLESSGARPEGRAYTRDERSIAASLLWALSGDAGQRAIVAQAMAWEPAQAISGTDWMVPHLAQLLDDPYDAVRLIAGRTLRTLPDFRAFPYDFAAAPGERRDAQRRVMDVWSRIRHRLRRQTDEQLLLAQGDVNVDAVLRLLKERNRRRVFLRE
jgi:nitrate/TMAO reductase-like tetraheme cytochrome c subunit